MPNGQVRREQSAPAQEKDEERWEGGKERESEESETEMRGRVK
jgi:hypothetical protein